MRPRRAEDMRAAIVSCIQDRVVDANGVVPMDDLSAAARHVVERAHRLSQQCQAPCVTHRLFLAALAEDEAGHAARVCRSAGVDTGLLQDLLVTIRAAGPHDEVENIVLSPEVCKRVFSPVLRDARQRTRNPRAVTDAELFHAFSIPLIVISTSRPS